MKKIITTIAIVSNFALVGCASYNESFKAADLSSRVIDRASIAWVATNDAVQICNALFHVGGKEAVKITDTACSVWNRSLKSCTIFTEKDTENAILGHEVRHCFEGHFHDQPQQHKELLVEKLKRPIEPQEIK